MLTALLPILSSLLPVILGNTGVLGTTGTTLLESLAAPVTTLIQGLLTGTTKTADFLAAMAALSGVVAVLKSTTTLPAAALTEVNNVDLDIQAALKAYATAGSGFNPATYAPITEVS